MGALGVAAAAVVLVAVVVAVNRGDDGSDGLSPATNPPATAETLPRPFDEGAALSMATAYSDAVNEGDLDALLGLFTVDATYAPGAGGTVDRAEFEQLMAWNLAQGTVLTTPECDTTEFEGAALIRVTCRYDHFDAVIQAIDGPPVPITLALTVTPEGVTEWIRGFGPPDFTFVGNPFHFWMERTHPDVAPQVEFGAWNSVAEAEANGLLNVRYAEEWAAYLEGNGCLEGDEPLPVKLAC
jgi:hypothetical protein